MPAPKARPEAISDRNHWKPHAGSMIPKLPSSWCEEPVSAEPKQLARDLCEEFLEGLGPGDAGAVLRDLTEGASRGSTGGLLDDAEAVTFAASSLADLLIADAEGKLTEVADGTSESSKEVISKVEDGTSESSNVAMSKAEAPMSVPRPIATPARRKTGRTSQAENTVDDRKSGEKQRRLSAPSRPENGLLRAAGHTLQPSQQGQRVTVIGDGWGGPGADYEAVVTEADYSTFTVVAVSGPDAWKETHVLKEHCRLIAEAPQPPSVPSKCEETVRPLKARRLSRGSA